jgi:hypothetical protein
MSLPPLPGNLPVVELPQIVPGFKDSKSNTTAGHVEIHTAHPPASQTLAEQEVPWLADDGKDAIVAPPASVLQGKVFAMEKQPPVSHHNQHQHHHQPHQQLKEEERPPPHVTECWVLQGILRIKDGEDLFTALQRLNLMYSMEDGTSCMGRVIDHGMIGVVERQGQVKYELSPSSNAIVLQVCCVFHALMCRVVRVSDRVIRAVQICEARTMYVTPLCAVLFVGIAADFAVL